MIVNGNNSFVSMKTRGGRATRLRGQCGSESVAADAALLAFCGDIERILYSDATVATARKPAERKGAIFTEPVDELARHSEKLRGLSGGQLILGAKHDDSGTSRYVSEHRTDRSLERAVTLQGLRQLVSAGAHRGIDRIESCREL
ncbi:hypothetical protein GCM10009851_10760 [Herbiconiux moechotypicola]|uniref:Uncharacterized protein n=1 Tax=Herbiconiux moechotypicola TaxID=637393 RepID=A0ABN3DDT0_9MICO